jgi:trehalose/maltose hydrolase-like predicted phosphorylase
VGGGSRDGHGGDPALRRGERERGIHLNADVAIAQWQYFLATGDLAWLREVGYPVIESAADFYAGRATYDPGRDRYDLLHVTSVDEKYTDVNNDAYTNAAARKCLAIAGRAAGTLGGDAGRALGKGRREAARPVL